MSAGADVELAVRVALHWPVAVREAKRLLAAALVTFGETSTGATHPPATPGPDAEAGMAWWNALTAAERGYWLMCAESSVPADAWRVFKTWEAHP